MAIPLESGRAQNDTDSTPKSGLIGSLRILVFYGIISLRYLGPTIHAIGPYDRRISYRTDRPKSHQRPYGTTDNLMPKCKDSDA